MKETQMQEPKLMAGKAKFLIAWTVLFVSMGFIGWMALLAR